MITLYRKHVNGIGTWSISSEGNVITIKHSTSLGGSEVIHTETVDSGLQGRTLSEQVKSRIDSRISVVRDKGYKSTIEEANKGSTNQLGLVSPVLAQPYDKVSKPNVNGAVLQKKLNGHRCLITNIGGEIVAYSRRGKRIPAIVHITDSLVGAIPEGETIDGELYVHGQHLQTIASWVKRLQPNTLRVMFVAYDIVSCENYKDRHAELSRMLDNVINPKIQVLGYTPYINHGEMIKYRDAVILNKFEGLMLKLDNYPYEPGVRSMGIIKVKRFNDAEFVVVDVVPSSDGWGICVCKTFEGKFFKVSAPGTMIEKQNVIDNKELFIGKKLTVEYAELTADNIPFHCSATGWREDI